MTEWKYARQLRRWNTRTVLSSVAAAFMIAGAVGCGDDDDGGGNGGGSASGGSEQTVAEAKKIVSDAEKTVEFTFDGESFDSAEASGKTVWFVPVGLEVPVTQAWLKGLEEALEVVGAEVKTFDSKGQVAEANRGIEQAVAANADLIIINGLPLEALSASIARAERADIPVVNTVGGKPEIPSDVPGVVAEVTFDFETVGTWLGAWAVAENGGEAVKALVVQSSEVMASEHEVRGIVDTIERLAPGSSVKVEDVPVAQWQTRLPTLTRTAVQRDPDLGYLIPLYDGMTLSMLPALQAAGAEDRVKIASFNATPAVLENVKAGTAMGADAGGPNTWFGWAMADQALRLMTGNEPVEDEQVPARLFTSTNIGEIDIDDESTYYGDIDFKAEYRRIWGVK
ncbi:MAG: ribose transport system substrate-binding protein [Thermoleophilaceae bacterium]|jgi:ribose transport system substrate-binding protein|nr:ribose transport system substrate-binding protein [Thermoleophilaceae bacterium]